MAKPPASAPPNREGPRVNTEIDSRTIRLIDADGEMVGVVSLREGLEMARDAGLDLVEVSPNAEP
ncbi:MAG: translation initiation factor IF-3, partial [Rhodospirillales bacterium]|nr:translation initiation factor IF-3 [Rhodospirillales bacterium]